MGSIKTDQDLRYYKDPTGTFFVQVLVDNTNQTKTIKSIKGPGISGSVSADDTDDFLALMEFVYINS